MAAVMKITSTLNVTLIDDQSYETVLKIDSPAENLSLSAVRAVFNPVISANLLYSKNDSPVQSVARASIVETTISTEALE